MKNVILQKFCRYVAQHWIRLSDICYRNISDFEFVGVDNISIFYEIDLRLNPICCLNLWVKHVVWECDFNFALCEVCV